MKVLLINGSPRKKGCTYTALEEIAKELEKSGVETEIVEIGNQPIRGCIACSTCRKTGTGRCVFNDDCVNELLEKVEKADGYVFGSPVYYASANGSMVSLMDRLFFAGSKSFNYKPAAVVVSARRAGTVSTYDQMNKYIQMSKMLMVPSIYWNMVHGSSPEDVRKDEEGLYIMRSLAKNMVWLLKMLENANQNGITPPDLGQPIRTNFIQ